MNNTVRKVIAAVMFLLAAGLVALVVLLVVPSFMAPSFSDYVSKQESPVGTTTDTAPVVDWAGLKERNPDVVGWVSVPGTNIDYPIVQAQADDPEYYLEHDLDGNWNWVGCPYLDYTCKEKGLLSSESLVFGHSLINGSMFSDFQYMSDGAFAEEHHTVWLLTPEWSKKLDVVVARVVNANYEQKVTGITTPQMAAEHLHSEAANAEVVRSVPASIERSWCFVTCSYQTNNSRTLTYCVER